MDASKQQKISALLRMCSAVLRNPAFLPTAKAAREFREAAEQLDQLPAFFLNDPSGKALLQEEAKQPVPQEKAEQPKAPENKQPQQGQIVNEAGRALV